MLASMTSLHEYGTPEYADDLTIDRHPAVRDALSWLTYSHLPPRLQGFSRPFFEAAHRLVAAVENDSPELTTALNKLVEAKDAAVRAGVKSQLAARSSITPAKD